MFKHEYESDPQNKLSEEWLLRLQVIQYYQVFDTFGENIELAILSQRKTNYRDNNNKIRLIISAMELVIEQCGRRPQKEVVCTCEIELLTKSTSWLNAMSKVTMTGLEPFGAGKICFSSW